MPMRRRKKNTYYNQDPGGQKGNEGTLEIVIPLDPLRLLFPSYVVVKNIPEPAL